MSHGEKSDHWKTSFRLLGGSRTGIDSVEADEVETSPVAARAGAELLLYAVLNNELLLTDSRLAPFRLRSLSAPVGGGRSR